MLTIGQNSFTCFGVEPFRVDAVQAVRVRPAATASRHVARRVRQVEHAALAEHHVAGSSSADSASQSLQRMLVDRRALVPEVVRADDRGVAAGVAAAEPAALEHRDVA
mgnify:CR=1 FL=1